MDDYSDGGEMDVGFLCCEMDVDLLLILTVNNNVVQNPNFL